MKKIMAFILTVITLATSVSAQDSTAKEQAKQYIKLGKKKIDIKEYDDGIKYLKKAAELDPDNGFAYIYLHSAYLKKGIIKMQNLDYNGAIADFTKSIDYLNIDLVAQFKYLNCEAYYNRAMCKYILKKYSQALWDFNDALKLNPSDQESYFMRGLTKFQLGDDSGGCSDFAQAQKLGKELPSEVYELCK